MRINMDINIHRYVVKNELRLYISTRLHGMITRERDIGFGDTCPTYRHTCQSRE